VATVIMPTLSAQSAAKRAEDYTRTLDWAVRSVLLVGIPASLALIILAEPILITLFHYGALTETDIAMASLSLRAYSVGLCAFMLVKVLAPGFYARKDMKTPVRIGIRAMVANMGMNLLLRVGPRATRTIGHVGLALATSLSACLNAGLLWRGLLREGVYRFDPVWRPFLARLGFACVLMVTALWIVTPIRRRRGSLWTPSRGPCRWVSYAWCAACLRWLWPWALLRPAPGPSAGARGGWPTAASRRMILGAGDA
jgi:putative peptidoglycan lipid II flippase